MALLWWTGGPLNVDLCPRLGAKFHWNPLAPKSRGFADFSSGNLGNLGQVAKQSRRRDAFSLTDFVGGASGRAQVENLNDRTLRRHWGDYLTMGASFRLLSSGWELGLSIFPYIPC